MGGLQAIWYIGYILERDILYRDVFISYLFGALCRLHRFYLGVIWKVSLIVFSVLLGTTEKLQGISDDLCFVSLHVVGILPASSFHAPLDEDFFTLTDEAFDDISKAEPADYIVIVHLFDFSSAGVLIFSIGSHGERRDLMTVRSFFYFWISSNVTDDLCLVHVGYKLEV